MPDQFEFTVKLAKQIQDINGNPALSAQEKKKAIESLQGAPKEKCFEYLNKNYRVGPGLAKSIAKHVSEGRPRGAPQDSAKGTKKKDK